MLRHCHVAEHDIQMKIMIEFAPPRAINGAENNVIIDFQHNVSIVWQVLPLGSSFLVYLFLKTDVPPG